MEDATLPCSASAIATSTPSPPHKPLDSNSPCLRTYFSVASAFISVHNRPRFRLQGFQTVLQRYDRVCQPVSAQRSHCVALVVKFRFSSVCSLLWICFGFCCCRCCTMGADVPDHMDEDHKEEVKPEALADSRLVYAGFSPDYLRIYYGRLFPYAEMFKWLSYGHDGKHPGCDASIMGRREFSFTPEHDIYMRYLSFHDVSEMEATIKSKCPHKIDIGALYNVEPAKRTAYAGGSDRVFAPVERELVFDIGSPPAVVELLRI